MIPVLCGCVILAVVKLNVIVGEQFENGVVNGISSTYEDIFGDNFHSLFKSLKWDKFVILHRSDGIIAAPNDSIQYIVYDLNITDTFSTLQEIHDSLFPEINVVASMRQRHLTELMKAEKGWISFRSEKAAIKLALYTEVSTNNIIHQDDTNTFPGVLEGCLQNLPNKVVDIDKTTKGMTDFQYHSKWLLFIEDLNIQELEMSSRNMGNIVVAAKMCTNATVRYLTLQHHPRGSIFVPVKYCPGSNTRVCYFPNTVFGYHNKRLVVGVVESHGYVHKVVSNGTAVYTGYAMDIVKILSKMLNFSYIITEPKDGDWGLPINDSYDGVVGQLYRREIDIAACDLTIDKGRSQYMEYIYPPIYTESLVVLYMKHDSSSNDSIFLLAGPFQPIVYIVVLLWTCVLPLLLTVVESLALDNRTPIQMEASNVSYTRMIKSNIFTYSWDFLGSLLKQGFCKQPSSTPGKVLVSSWWMMVLVLTSVYSANLIAAFSLRNDIHPFSNLEELLHSDYAIGMIPTGLSYYIIKTSRRSSLLGRLWDRITNTDLALLQANASVHLQRLKRDQYAYLDYRSYADRIMAKDCRLDVLDERITWEHLAFGVQQRSPLKADIERVMFQLQESGILDRLWRKWNVEPNMTNCVPETTVNAITSTQIGGGYIVVGLGITLSAVVLCIEKLKHFACRTKNG